MLSLRLAGADGAPDAHLEIDADPRQQRPRRAAARRRRPEARPAEPAAGRRGRRAGAGVRAARRRAATRRRSRRTRATSVVDQVRRPDRAPRARARAQGGREGADHRAPAPRRRARRGPQPARRRGSTRPRRSSTAAHATRSERIDVLLARAAHARGGVELARRDPVLRQACSRSTRTTSPATLATVELYDEAGLRDTALALLAAARSCGGRAASRSLRAMVGALRERGPRRPRPTRWPSATRRCASTIRRSRASGSSSRSRGATRRRRRAGSIASLATNPDSAGALRPAAQACLALGRPAARDRDVPSARSTSRPRTPTRCARSPTSTGSAGERDEQLRLLKRVLELMPQAKDVREYVAHIEPAKPRPDEAVRAPARGVPREARRAGRAARTGARSSTCR